METSVFCSDLSVTQGITLGRLTAKALIRDSLEGHLEGDPIQDELKRRERKPKVIEMSKKYCIVTQVILSIKYTRYSHRYFILSENTISVLTLSNLF